MAELLAALGSAAAITQLAGQLASSLERLYKFWKQVKGAPKQVEELLEEIRVFATVLKSVETTTHDENDSLSIALQYVRNAVKELEDILEELEKGLNRSGFKSKLRWGSLKIVFKDNTLMQIVQKLERAKSMLGLAIKCHPVIVSSNTSYNIQIYSKTIVEMHHHSPNMPVTAAVSPLLAKRSMIPRSQKVSEKMIQTYWLGIGTLQRLNTCFIDDLIGEGQQSNEAAEVELKFFPTTWLITTGFSLKMISVYGQWNYSWTPLNIRPGTSPVFEACETGNVEEVRRLIVNREASIYDTMENGCHLLHVAASYQRYGLCSWLISNGVVADAVDATGRTALHKAASDGNSHSEYLKEPGLNALYGNATRSTDILDTMRVLVEEGLCDPMARAWGPYGMLSKVTALHIFTGSVDALQYLLRQEKFSVDIEFEDEKCLYNPIEMQMRIFWPESLQIISALMRANPNLEELVMRANRSDQSTLLHGAIEKLHYPFKPSGDEKYSEACKVIIEDILRAGADVHAMQFNGVTALSLFACSNDEATIDLHATASRQLLWWFDLLGKAGFDLQKYLRKEGALHPEFLWRDTSWERQSVIKNSRLEINRHPLNRCSTWVPYQITRLMELESSLETSELLLHIKEEICCPEDLQIKYLAKNVPGSWNPEGVKFHIIEDLWLTDQVTFCIGPLIDGVQECKVLEDVKHRISVGN